MFLKTKTHFEINLSSFVFKMALSKVDLSNQIVVLQNIWISTCNIFNSVISFLTERHKRQRKIILKMLIAESKKRRNTKKKEREPPRYWVRPGRSNIWWTNILNSEWSLVLRAMWRVKTIFNKADYQTPKTKLPSPCTI